MTDPTTSGRPASPAPLASSPAGSPAPLASSPAASPAPLASSPAGSPAPLAGSPAGLADRVNQIHVPEPNADRERMMLLVGGVLVAVGIIAVLVGYLGASGTTNVYEQVPYAISGGVLGLGLIVLGCALITRFSLARLFRFWLARTLHEHQVQTDRTVAALGRIEALLAAGAAGAVSSAPVPPADATASVGPSEDTHRVRREPLRAEPLEK